MALQSGSAQVDITPKDSQFLYGYPHVERYSTGVHDKLWASSLFLSDGNTDVLFIANDIIWVSKEVVKNARIAISDKTGLNPENIMITSTHTHSGPHTIDYVSNQADPAIPKADQKYVKLMQNSIIQAGIEAYQNARPAKLGLEIGDDTGVGTNRRDPNGPADHNLPVLLVKNAETDANIACMLVCSMHPTVMHEDSTLVSGDFPGLARIYLQERILGKNCPVVYHMGPSGNQSPRHVTKANTFEEAERIGGVLGEAVEKAISGIKFKDDIKLTTKTTLINELPTKTFPDVQDAEENLKKSIEKLKQLRKTNAPKTETRTAECDWFGAEETLTLSKAAVSGLLENGHKSCLPAEIQVIQIGDWNFIGWQGEVFIEYSLEVKQKAENSFVITLANGDMQGYIVTKEAADEGGYEASNALYQYKAGEIFVNKTLETLEAMK